MMRWLMLGRTTFIVTHQTETLKLADRVLFLENGRLSGDSTHTQLLEEHPGYAALWKIRGSAYQSKVRNRAFARDDRKKRQPVSQ